VGGRVSSDDRVAVLGAGACGLALAGHLALLGQRVTLYNRSGERLQPLRNAGGVRLRGAISGLGVLAEITADVRRTVVSAPLLLVAVPAYAHRDVAVAIAPWLTADHCVVLLPGRTGGALEVRAALTAVGVSSKVTVAETQTVLHTCRVDETQFAVDLHAVKRTVAVAALPADRTAAVVSTLAQLLPQFEAAPDVLHTSLGNVGCILHPAPTLLNTGWVETLRTQFLHYYEGITQSVGRVLERLDAERVAMARALGVQVPTAIQWLDDAYGARGDTLYDAIQSNPAYRRIAAPSSLHHRFLMEDIPTGLVPLTELASLVGVPCPLTELFIELGRAACGVDFRRCGRTLERMGLAGMSAEAVRAHVRT